LAIGEGLGSAEHSVVGRNQLNFFF